MADLKMKLNTNNDLRLKMKSTENITMKFDDYQKFKEEDPIFKDSPAYTITYNDIESWNNKSDFSGNYNDLTNKPNLSNFATYTYVNSGLSDKVDKVEGMGLSENSFTTEEKTKLASLENYDDTAIVEELATKADISDIPTSTNQLTNDSGFITNTVDDLVNYPTTTAVNGLVAQKQNIIDSENKLSADLVDDTSTTNKFVTASDITTWNSKSDFSGDYNDLTNKPTIPTLTSQLTNDSGFITNANIPTKTSDLTNDSGYVTNEYSTSETVIGKWIDGKTLYRKVFTDTMPQVVTDGTFVTKQISYSSLGVDTLFIENAFFIGSPYGEISYNTIPTLNSNNLSQGVLMDYYGSNLEIKSNRTLWNSFTFYLIINYTKV